MKGKATKIIDCNKVITPPPQKKQKNKTRNQPLYQNEQDFFYIKE